MKTIYVCTSGSYSDYSIRGVFDNEELAKDFCSKFGCNIEEYTLNPFAKQLRKGYDPFFVHMTKEGDTVQIHREDSAYGFENDFNYGFDVNKNMYVHCFASSAQHAIKIANERRVALIANDQWGK